MTKRTYLFSTTACIFLSASGLHAQSYTTGSGGEGIFYGHLNPSYLVVDDGKETDSNLTDNSHSNSRVGFWFNQPLDNDQMLRFNFETGIGAPQSSARSQDFSPEWKLERTDIRKVEAIWSGNFGTFSAGQGSMASDGIATHDSSNTANISSVTVSDTAGSYKFRLSDGDLSDVTIGSAFKDLDGSRKFRVRYDTPDINGLVLGTSYGREVLAEDVDTEYYDIGAVYTRDTGDFELGVGAGYAWERDDGATTRSYAGSVTVLHTDTGLNGTLAGGAAIDGGSYGYGKIGWLANFWSVGYTAFSADYYSGSDFVGSGSSSEFWGVQVVQKVEDADLELYLGYGVASFDDKTDAKYNDLKSTMAGLRWSF